MKLQQGVPTIPVRLEGLPEALPDKCNWLFSQKVLQRILQFEVASGDALVKDASPRSDRAGLKTACTPPFSL